MHPITYVALATGLLSAGCSSSPSVALTIVIVGDGTVTASPGGACSGPKTCPVITVSQSKNVVLSGAPANGWVAQSWELDVGGATVALAVDPDGTVTVNGSKGSEATVTVTFVTIGSQSADGGKKD